MKSSIPFISDIERQLAAPKCVTAIGAGARDGNPLTKEKGKGEWRCDCIE